MSWYLSLLFSAPLLAMAAGPLSAATPTLPSETQRNACAMVNEDANSPSPTLETRISRSGKGHARTAEALNDQTEVIDALYRFGAGQDLDDSKLFASAFADHAELDFVQPAKRLGIDLPVFQGKEAIVSSIMATASALDTTHTVTNPRVTLCGDRAHLVALVEAQHLPKGDGSRHLLLKNWYDVDLIRAGLQWQITRLRITNVWMDGEAGVLFAGAKSKAD